MKIKSWLKGILDKWFPEIKKGIISKNEKGNSIIIKQKRYPVCHGRYLPSEKPIKNI